MNDAEHERDLFLLDQKIWRLSDNVPLKHRRYHVCGDGQPPKNFKKEDEKPIWEATMRLPPKVPGGTFSPSFVAIAMSQSPWKRVAVVCEAGLGKTTNMRWLQAHLSERGSRVVPLLLQLHFRSELDLLVNESKEPDGLLSHLARRVAGDDKNIDRHLNHLKKLQKLGRITLLIDGLDHGLSQVGGLPEIIDKLLKNSWASCPVWISGRPNAFSLAPDLVFDPNDRNWSFLRVAGLDVADIRFYLREQVEPDPKNRTTNDWYMALPEDGRELLAIPRFLHLVAGELRDEVADAKKASADPLRAIEELDLHTRADVYRLAYFSRGEDVAPRHRIVGKDDHREKRGLIAQGLDACYEFNDGQTQYLGLRKSEPPDDKNLARRIRFTAGLLGAIAFEMYANPYEYGTRSANAKQMPLQPNTAGILETDMEAFEDAVWKRLLTASPIFKPEFIENAFLVLGANNRTVDYVMFHDLDEKVLAWHDPTVQAFFAAYWAMNYTTPPELATMDCWKVVLDDEGKRLEGFDEFWQFAAEMPDQLLHDNNYENWFTTFGPSYAPPQELEGDDDRVQWHRRMIYHSYLRLEQRSLQITNEQLRDRSSQTIKDWRALWLKLTEGKGTKKRMGAFVTIHFCNCPPTLVEKLFTMGTSLESDPDRYQDEVLRKVVVKPFAMQDFPVTNAQYELFDPKHKKERCDYSESDGQPVIFVTFWDAWCFAKWTGNRLPKEEEWEYACRAGTTTQYNFGENINPSLCNYGGMRVGRTTAKGEFNYPKNNWGMFNMHGNVWEWCDSRYQPGGSGRVVRGGGWGSWGEGECRASDRFESGPGTSHNDQGFRLLAVPVLEPSNTSKKRA